MLNFHGRYWTVAEMTLCKFRLVNTLSMHFPKIVDFEQKMPQIRNLKNLGIQPKYWTLMEILKSIPWEKFSDSSLFATIFTKLTLIMKLLRNQS